MHKLFFNYIFSLFASIYFCFSCTTQNTNQSVTPENAPETVFTNYTIPLGGNAFSSNPMATKKIITDNGIENWTDSQEWVSIYFKIPAAGKMELKLLKSDLKTVGNATLEFSINGIAKKTTFSAATSTDYTIGNWDIQQAGYVELIIKGISKDATTFPSISNIRVGTTTDALVYVPNNEGNFFHWGRRGPSVHLNYTVPTDRNSEWYYNEITVAENQDPIGSYYMATGFGEGYFGMQVNSASERRILFSVWSPFETDDPSSIPESKKIKLLKKGEGVTAGQFGGEGSGGQSYWKYNWKTGETYKFLLRGTPQSDNSTIYTAYFKSPDNKDWKLIASFSRPETQTYLKRFHSFLENFAPTFGHIAREVKFDNQWVCDSNGNWTEINAAKFTIDNTGNKGYRLDYAGGLSQNSFFLKNCGFFENNTKPQTVFNRPITNQKPIIDFTKLP